MHNFLFRNKLSTYSPFSPFGSSKNSKPGIITKLKNKIQDLFQPTINPSSTIQRIQCYNELNLEKELSHQFQNNLVIVDHILPNQEHNQTSKRKSLYPFDLYYQEVIQKQNQTSQESNINQAIKLKDQQPYLNKPKKQMKFKKNHAKIQKHTKMEDNSQQIDLDYNLKSQNFNVEFNQENSSNFLSNYSIKKIKYQDNCIEKPPPSNNQEVQTKGQMSQINQFEIQSFANIKQNQQFSCQQFNDQKRNISDTQNGISCNIVNFKQFIQENQYFSSSTGTNTKGEPQELLFNMEHISFSQHIDSSISEEQCSINSSFEIQNKLFSIFHPDPTEQANFIQVQEQQLNKSQNEHQNNEYQNQIDSLGSQKQFKKQKKLLLDSNIVSLQIQCNRSNLNEFINQQCKIDSEIQQQQCQQSITQEKSVNISNDDSVIYFKDENVIIQNVNQIKIGNNQCIFQNNDKIQQQPQIEQINHNQQLIQQLDKKPDSPQSQNTLMSVNYQSTPKTSNIIHEFDQIKESNQNTDQLLKQNNPFLNPNSHIDSEQVSQYFLSGLVIENSQISQQQQQTTKNQKFSDLFKMPRNNQLFKFNILSENQTYQTQTQNLFDQQNISQKDNQCLIYKQMETIDVVPQYDQFNFSQQNNFHQSVSNYYSPNFEQKYQSQPDAFKQSQSSMPWNSYQVPLQQQNLFPQMQQSSYQISSINLFQSNSSMTKSNPNCCQESRINNLYTKQDVLSLFQDTNKTQDQNLFVIDSKLNSNSQSQNLNNSFTRGQKKKQRINND
ncbi:unnamed protein product [Paramecium sonneborni]|uniref:Uncharacterized protein n=1 Tax=Paramecium sonneborni TaxID=65129 RepID=A0A8S1NBM9_9CILI|nr:unnamed protein product [Paramecium sonneborni]